MGLFCGKKCKCKRNCKSWFGLQPDLERACINACKNNTGLQKDQFLCSGQYVDEAVIIGAYGYDPCSGGISVEDYLDPLDDREGDQAKLKNLMPVYIGLGLLILVGIYYLVKR